LLITGDKDFGEIVFRDNRLSSGGVVLLRLAGLSAEKKAEIVSDAFREYGAQFANHFSVVAPGKVRIRPKGAT
jgi:predicted nuclease of predicted toxin-antitoxin system